MSFVGEIQLTSLYLGLPIKSLFTWKLVNAFLFNFRTKWKRQTAVGLELLAESNSYGAFRSLPNSPYWPYGYGSQLSSISNMVNPLPAHSSLPTNPSGLPSTGFSSMDMLYRQAQVMAMQRNPVTSISSNPTQTSLVNQRVSSFRPSSSSTHPSPFASSQYYDQYRN